MDRLELTAELDGYRPVMIESDQAASYPGERAMHNHLSKIERAFAIVLSLVWTVGGGAAMVVALRSGDWRPGALAVCGVLYGITWLRVGVLGRKLTWQESLRF